MSKYSLRITIPKDADNNGAGSAEKLSLNTILGEEFDEYYDGWGVDYATKNMDYFFMNVPQPLIDTVPSKLASYPALAFHFSIMLDSPAECIHDECICLNE